MRRQFSWLGALQNCTNHNFFKTNQNSNVLQNIWQIMLLLYLFLNVSIRYLSIFILTEPLMHFLFGLGPKVCIWLFADCGIGFVLCVCAIASSISISPPSVTSLICFFIHVSRIPSYFMTPGHATLSKWQTKELLSCSKIKSSESTVSMSCWWRKYLVKILEVGNFGKAWIPNKRITAQNLYLFSCFMNS